MEGPGWVLESHGLRKASLQSNVKVVDTSGSFGSEVNRQHVINIYLSNLKILIFYFKNMEEYLKVLFVRKVAFLVSFATRQIITLWDGGRPILQSQSVQWVFDELGMRLKKNQLFLSNTTFNIFLEIKFICRSWNGSDSHWKYCFLNDSYSLCQQTFFFSKKECILQVTKPKISALADLLTPVVTGGNHGYAQYKKYNRGYRI